MVKRLSMMRIIANRMKAATVVVQRSKSWHRRWSRLIQAKVLSTTHRLGKTMKHLDDVGSFDDLDLPGSGACGGGTEAWLLIAMI